MAINVPIITAFSDAGINQAEKAFKKFGKTGVLVGAAFAASATAIVAGLGKAVQAAAEDQKSQALLEAQLKATFGEQNLLTASIERYIATAQLATGVSDTDLRSAYASLTRATGSVTESQKLLNLALDISAGSGKDLETITLGLAKAANGQFGALTRLGIPLDENIIKSKDLDAVTAALSKQFGGAAEAGANTFSGQLKILKGQFGEIVETVGTALLPHLQRLTKFLTDKVAPAVQRITTVIGEKGLVAGLQQFVFEAGSAGPKIVNAFKTVTVALATMANVGASAFHILKASLMDIRNPGAIIDEFSKAFTSFIDIDKLRQDFDNFGNSINQYGGSLGGANKQQLEFLERLNGTAEAAGGGGGGGGGGAKAKVESFAKALKDGLGDALKSANTELGKAQQKFDDFATSVTSAIKAGVSFGGIFQLMTSAAGDAAKASSDVTDAREALAKAITAGDLEDITAAQLALTAAQKADTAAAKENTATFLDRLKTQVDGVKDYAKAVEAALNLGLSEESLQMVLAAGQEAGTAIALELIAGGKAAIDATNDMVLAAQTAAEKVGIKAANKWYQSGIDFAANVVNGLQAELTKLTPKLMAQMDKIAANLKRTVDVTVRISEIVSRVAAGAIPKMAAGGIVTSPTLALIGEAGPEAVVPLSQYNRGSGGSGVTINVNGGLATSAEIGQSITNALRAYVRTNGPLQLAIA